MGFGMLERYDCLDWINWLNQNGFAHEQLRCMNEDFIRENISPGGSADLLALTYFLHLIENGGIIRERDA
jgi:triphosphoribosyl-dephospho-CoA synthetase